MPPLRLFRMVAIVTALLATLTGCSEFKGVDESAIPFVTAPATINETSVTWFADEQNRFGLRDKNGHEIVKPTYDDVRQFSEGLAAVNVGAKFEFPSRMVGGKWGYVDETGALLIPVQYDSAGDFSDGLANVGDASGGTVFIDRGGKICLRLPEERAGDFRARLMPVHRDRSLKGLDWLTEYMDKSGGVRFAVGGYGEEFYEGLAVLIVRDCMAVSNEHKSYGFIDTTCKIVIDPQFGEASHFSEGLAAVRTVKTTVYGMGDSWGYIDKTGKYVIEPDFNEARPFRDGRAMVHEGGKLVELHDAPPYWDGGTWWLIDTTGKKVGKIPE